MKKINRKERKTEQEELRMILSDCQFRSFFVLFSFSAVAPGELRERIG
jgi:hypothetical protein